MKRYVGRAGDCTWTVHVETCEDGLEGVSRAPLPPRNDVFNHSPTGVSWGYNGSGPAQCALAILCDCIGVKAATRKGLYQEYKARVIAAIPQDQDWAMTEEEVKAAVAAIERAAPPDYDPLDHDTSMNAGDEPPDPPQF